MAPDPQLDAQLCRDGLIQPGQQWHPLSGGQTNQLWRVGSVVVKRFAPQDDNPRFPNDPAQEIGMLRHLQGRGLAQRLLGHIRLRGVSYLVYRHLRGRSWDQGVADVARLLRDLHGIKPVRGLRSQPGGSAALEAQVQQILPDLPADLAELLRSKRPKAPPVAQSGRLALLHGDPVPGNLIVTPDGLRLIDWQCPAVGDPVEDLALFISPAMQLIYRGKPLDPAEAAEFTRAYGCPDTAARLQAMQPWHHWAMAAYCAWKSARGAQEYARAMTFELAAL